MDGSGPATAAAITSQWWLRAAAGIGAVALAVVHRPHVLGVAYGGLAVLLAAVCLADLAERRVPDELVVLGAGVGVLAIAVAGIIDHRPQATYVALVGSALFAAPLAAVRIVRPGGLGPASMKLGLLLGAALGLAHPVLSPLALAIGLLAALGTRRSVVRAAALPLPTTLSVATIAVLLAAPWLLDALGLPRW